MEKLTKMDGFKSSYLVAFLLLLVVMAFDMAPGANAQKAGEKTTEMTFPVDCRPYHMRSMKVLLKNFNRCSRELKANVSKAVNNPGDNNEAVNKEYEENIGCAMKCTMRALEFSENDIVTEQTMRRCAAKLVPSGLVDVIVGTLKEKCHRIYGNKLDPNEPKCASYSEYAFCIQNCIADMIDSEFCIKYDKKGNPISS